MKDSALFIGRFQPFHKGHLSVIKGALNKTKRLFIGIGSAEKSRTDDNPFTAGERFQMIEAALKEEGIDPNSYAIVPIRDINDYDRWVDHVASLLPPFSRVYTGSDIVKRLYEEHGGYEVVDVEFELEISATKVRELLKTGGDWQSLVPDVLQALFEKWKIEERIREIKD